MLTPEQLREELAEPVPQPPPRCRFGRPHRWFGTLERDVFVCDECDAISGAGVPERRGSEGYTERCSCWYRAGQRRGWTDDDPCPLHPDESKGGSDAREPVRRCAEDHCRSQPACPRGTCREADRAR